MRDRRWLGLVVLSLGVAMIMVDATIVNVAVPTIIKDLGLTTTDAEWINSIYSLVIAALLISLGRAGDIYGRRRLFLLGTVLFAAASVLAAQAGNGVELIAGRAAQGIGAAMVLPATLSTVNATFVGRQRAIAFGIWGSMIGGMAAVGPVLGGWLTTDFSWRWAFGINVPIAALLIAGAYWFVRETTDPHAGRGGDPIGAVTSALGLAAVVFALIEGQRYGWLHPAETFSVAGVRWPVDTISPVPVAFALGLVLLALFVATERARQVAGRPVLMDLSLFGIPSFRNGVLAAAIVSLGQFGLLFALTLFMQNALGFSALHTGLTLLALAAGSFAAGPAAAGLSHRFGARAVVQAGLLLEVIGIAGVGLALGPAISAWQLVAPLAVYGVGVGLAIAQLTSVILADVPVAQSGVASGTQSTFRQVGSALGIAVLGTVLVAGLGHDTSKRLAAAGVSQPGPLVAAVKSSAGTSIAGMRARPGDQRATRAVEAAITDATRRVSYTAAGFVLLGLITTTRLSRRRPENTPEEVRVEAGVGPG
jgi:EmrB/QacA subfamily drug resistance transporter